MTEQISVAGLLEHPVLLVVLIVANWPLYRWFVQILFGGVEGMGEAVKYWFIPDLYSFLTNRYFEDWWAELNPRDLALRHTLKRSREMVRF